MKRKKKGLASTSFAYSCYFIAFSSYHSLCARHINKPKEKKKQCENTPLVHLFHFAYLYLYEKKKKASSPTKLRYRERKRERWNTMALTFTLRRAYTVRIDRQPCFYDDHRSRRCSAETLHQQQDHPPLNPLAILSHTTNKRIIIIITRQHNS